MSDLIKQNSNGEHHSLDPTVQDSISMERSGKRSRELSEKLLAAPEKPLSVEDAELAISFESEMCDYKVSEVLTLEALIQTRKSETHTYYAEAFLNGHVQVPGLEGTLRQHQTPEDVYKFLALAARDKTINTSDLRELSRQSISFYKTEMQHALLSNSEPHESLFDSISIAIEPEKVLEFARAGREARQYIKAQRKAYSAEDSGLDGAKRALVDIYTKKVNGLVMSDVSTLQCLINQSTLIEDEETITNATEIMSPSFLKAVSNPATRSILYKRFDYIRNGIGYDGNGRASAVDNDIFVTLDNQNEAEVNSPLYSIEDRERLRGVVLNKKTIHELLKGMVSDGNMLSSEDESTWSPARGRRAEDGLFQVVYQPVKDTLSVNGIDGTLKTPNKERSLYDVITVSVHELTHINQSQADQALGSQLRIGRLKGRRVSMLREAGANLVQRRLEMELFGASKPVAYAYARAIQCFEAGGSIFEANKAFYEEKLQAGFVNGKAAAAKEAADRVLRLGNGSSSAPLSYVEEILMNYDLAQATPEVQSRATQITTLDLDDQVRLHKYGLLPEVTDSGIDWTTIVMNRMRPYMDDTLKP
jgi:hypothetical protein